MRKSAFGNQDLNRIVHDSEILKLSKNGIVQALAAH
jgi:hypothetical protein